MGSHTESEAGAAEDDTDEDSLVADGGDRSGLRKRIPNRGRIDRWPANDYY